MFSLLCWSVLWFGIIFAMVLIGAKLFEKKVWPKFKKKAKRLRNFMASAELARSANEYAGVDGMMSHFFRNEDETKYRKSNYTGRLAGKILSENLKKFFTVETLSQVCVWRTDQCENVIKLTGKGGNTFYLYFRTSMEKWKNSVRELYKKVQEDGLTIDLDDDDYFEITNSLTLVHPGTIDQDNEDLNDLYAVFNMAEVAYINVPYTPTYSTQVCRFAQSDNGFFLQQVDQPIEYYSDEILNASYNDFNIQYKGEPHMLKPSQARKIAEIALMNGQNVYNFGQMGCGKTTFARQVLAGIKSTEDNVRIVSIPPAMLISLQQPAAQAAFIRLLDTSTEDYAFDYEENRMELKVVRTKNIIFIDEAEGLLAQESSGLHTDVQAFLLSMMDGELKETLNCQVILAFNREKEYLNPKVFRSQRAGMEFHMQPIPMDRAKELVKMLKIKSPHLRFDQQKFHNFITDITNASDGKMYAAAGFTTLADVVSCFTAPEIDDAIITALRGLKIPQASKAVIEQKTEKVPVKELLEKSVKKSPEVVMRTRNVGPAKESAQEVPQEAPQTVPSINKHRNRKRNRKR